MCLCDNEFVLPAMIQKNTSNNNCGNTYTSCIKINGIPILPPMITPERCKELQVYKLKAVEIERRLKTTRFVRDCLKDLDVNPQPQTSLENQLAYNLPEIKVSLYDAPNKTKSKSRPNNVPSKDQNFNLTCNIVDVSEYSDDGVKLFNKNTTCSKPELLFEDINKSNEELHVIEKPRLIRSNSYTLESPSPVVLAQLDKINRTASCVECDLNQEECPLLPYWSIDSKQQSLLNSSDDTSKEGVEDSQTFNIVGDKAALNTAVKEDAKVSRDPEKLEILNEIVKYKEGKIESDITEKNLKLLKILNNVPGNYTKEILDFFEDNDAFNKLKELFMNKSNEEKLFENSEVPNNVLINSPNYMSTPTNKQLDALSFTTSSQTLYYTINSSDEITNGSPTPVGNLIDFDCDINFDNSDNKVRSNTNAVELIDMKEYALNCSRELFPDKCGKWTEFQKREWAASIIGAYAKGYLTRRLLRTDKVKSLIQTIKDALICAMELHMESSEDINESDVELHRRLIQQVSAACCAFHDIFFTLSIKEQMAVIAQDRHRLVEKAKRPSSTSSSTTSLKRAGSGRVRKK